MVLLSVFFPSFGLLLYYNTQAAHAHTHAYTHAHRRTYAHRRTHAHAHARTHTHTHTHSRTHAAYTWWAHRGINPLVAPGENELAT